MQILAFLYKSLYQINQINPFSAKVEFTRFGSWKGQNDLEVKIKAFPVSETTWLAKFGIFDYFQRFFGHFRISPGTERVKFQKEKIFWKIRFSNNSQKSNTSQLFSSLVFHFNSCAKKSYIAGADEKLREWF